jgi:hypothetical protein
MVTLDVPLTAPCTHHVVVLPVPLTVAVTSSPSPDGGCGGHVAPDPHPNRDRHCPAPHRPRPTNRPTTIARDETICTTTTKLHVSTFLALFDPTFRKPDVTLSQVTWSLSVSLSNQLARSWRRPTNALLYINSKLNTMRIRKRYTTP